MMMGGSRRSAPPHPPHRRIRDMGRCPRAPQLPSALTTATSSSWAPPHRRIRASSPSAAARLPPSIRVALAAPTSPASPSSSSAPRWAPQPIPLFGISTDQDVEFWARLFWERDGTISKIHLLSIDLNTCYVPWSQCGSTIFFLQISILLLTNY